MLPDSWTFHEAPDILRIPLLRKLQTYNALLYIVALNQHELLKNILPLIRLVHISPNSSPTSEAKSKGCDNRFESFKVAATRCTPILSLRPGREEDQTASSKPVFIIEINNLMLIEALQNCAAFGAYECALLLLNTFHSELPSALHNDETIINSPDFFCYAIQHGPRMMSLFENLHEFPLSPINFSMLECMFTGEFFSLCPTAFTQSIDYFIANLEGALNIQTGKESIQTNIGDSICSAKSQTISCFFCKLLCPVYMLFSALCTRGTWSSGTEILPMGDVHEQLPHWRTLHGCCLSGMQSNENASRSEEMQVSAPSQRGEIKEPEKTREQTKEIRDECVDLEGLMSAMQKLFDFEQRAPAIYLTGKTTSGQLLQIPPISLCFCMCLKLAVELLPKISAYKMSLLSQLDAFPCRAFKEITSANQQCDFH